MAETRHLDGSDETTWGDVAPILEKQDSVERYASVTTGLRSPVGQVSQSFLSRGAMRRNPRLGREGDACMSGPKKDGFGKERCHGPIPKSAL